MARQLLPFFRFWRSFFDAINDAINGRIPSVEKYTMRGLSLGLFLLLVFGGIQFFPNAAHAEPKSGAEELIEILETEAKSRIAILDHELRGNKELSDDDRMALLQVERERLNAAIKGESKRLFDKAAQVAQEIKKERIARENRGGLRRQASVEELVEPIKQRNREEMERLLRLYNEIADRRVGGFRGLPAVVRDELYDQLRSVWEEAILLEWQETTIRGARVRRNATIVKSVFTVKGFVQYLDKISDTSIINFERMGGISALFAGALIGQNVFHRLHAVYPGALVELRAIAAASISVASLVLINGIRALLLDPKARSAFHTLQDELSKVKRSKSVDIVIADLEARAKANPDLVHKIGPSEVAGLEKEDPQVAPLLRAFFGKLFCARLGDMKGKRVPTEAELRRKAFEAARMAEEFDDGEVEQALPKPKTRSLPDPNNSRRR